MPVRDRGQAPELGLAVLAKLALQNAPGGGTAQGFVGFIDLRQQLDIGSRIAAGEKMAGTGFEPHPPPSHLGAQYPRKLCAAQPSHLSDVAPEQTPRPPSMPCVLLLA